MKLRLNKNLKFLLGYTILKTVLDIIYVFYITDIYSYEGFKIYFEFNNYLFSWGGHLIIINILLHVNKNKISYFYLNLIYILSFLPISTLFGIGNGNFIFYLISHISFIITILTVKYSPDFRVIYFKYGKFVAWSCVSLISLTVYGYLLSKYGFSAIFSFSFNNMYDIRESVSLGTLFEYLLVWQAKVINPILLTYFYMKKHYRLAIFILFLQIFLFINVPHKAYVIAIIFILLFLALNKLLKLEKRILQFSILTIISVSVYEFINHNTYIASVLIRRLLFFPALIKYKYYDFFTANDYLYFSQGVIGKLFNLKYRYPLPIQEIIGRVYFSSDNQWVNTGYVADAFANFGVLGVILFSILIGFILIAFDSLEIKFGKTFIIGVSFFSIVSLNDGALLTSLLTGGLSLMLILLILLPNINFGDN